MSIKDIAKAMGSLSASLAEATESELGLLILIKDNHIGVFMGGQSELMDNDHTVRKLRQISGHLNTLAQSIVDGKTKADGTAYAMDDKGKVVPLDKKTSTGEADISLLA